MVLNSSFANALEGTEEKWPHDWQNDVVYLNNAGEAELSNAVRDVGISAINRPPWEINDENDLRRIRELFARLIETSASNIAIVPSTAFAMTLAARNIQHFTKEKKGKILVIEDQMCSAIYPWQMLCSESGSRIQLDIVPYPTDSSTGWTEAILRQLTEDVIVVCLPPLHWSDGSLLNLEKIGEVCRSKGIYFIVDATQAVGIMPCSVALSKPHLLACSVHKWLRGPPGMSLVYVSPSLHDQWSPLDFHGRSRDFPPGSEWEISRHEMSPSGYPAKFYNDARKYDSGGKTNPILVPMLRAALEEVVLLDVNRAQQQLKELTTPLLKWAKQNSYSLPFESHASHLIGIRPPNRTNTELIKMCDGLKSKGIYVAVRCGGFRISPYLSTTEQDIQRLIQALDEITNCI